MISRTRKQLFALLKSQKGYVYGNQREAFGQFVAAKGIEKLDRQHEEMRKRLTPPFDIETVLRWYFQVTSLGHLDDPTLAKFIGEYEEWKEKS